MRTPHTTKLLSIYAWLRACAASRSDGTFMLQVSTETSTATAVHKLDAATCVEGVLVEGRALNYTIVALESAVGVPGIDLLTLAHGKSNSRWAEELVVSSKILHREFLRGRLKLLPMPVHDLEMRSPLQWGIGYNDEYNRLMTSPSFWKLFKCDTILLFQSDSVFCRNTEVRLSEFLQYPYIGGITPGFDAGEKEIQEGEKEEELEANIILPPPRRYLNGGFSLRKRPEILKCIAQERGQMNGHMEDDFYSHCETLAQPPVSVANRFAIDNAHIIPSEAPLGVHKPWGDGPYHQEVMHLCEGAEKLYKEMSIQQAREQRATQRALAIERAREMQAMSRRLPSAWSAAPRASVELLSLVVAVTALSALSPSP